MLASRIEFDANAVRRMSLEEEGRERGEREKVLSTVSTRGNLVDRRTRPDTRHKLRLVCVLFTFENNTGPTDGPTDGRTDGHDLIWRCDGASKNGDGRT